MKYIHVTDSLQDYQYELVAPAGEDFAPEFTPDLTPTEMLQLGVFGGDYFHGEHDEYPAAWFSAARLSDRHDPEVNYFQINASQPLSVWQQKGWIYDNDPRGWFQWYYRYYLGRRLSDGEDERQIRRWKNMKRHVSQVQKYCAPGDLACRRRQRQALLHWAYDSRKL